MRWGGKLGAGCVALSILLGFLCGCERMLTSRQAQLAKDAETKATQGDFARAINLYEAALDDNPSCADIHFRLALLYDDKLDDPLNALHHFKRYLVLAPSGPHAADVQKFMKRDELALATSLSGDAVVTRAEATRLRNENLNLRKELEQRAAKARSAAEKATAAAEKTGSKKSEQRTYVVQSGDTLASISRKFYHSSARWKEILDANRKSIDDPEKLRVGQSLIIP
jgi:LysM repeat protein